MPAKLIKVLFFALSTTLLIFLIFTGVVHLFYCNQDLSEYLHPGLIAGYGLLTLAVCFFSFQIYHSLQESEKAKLDQIAQLQKEITEKEKIEHALRKSEERFQLAMAGANDGLFDTDEKSGRLYYSPRWKSMLGYEDDEIGTSLDEWKSRIHPDDYDRAVNLAEEFVAGNQRRFEVEFRLRHKDGHYLNIISRAFALKDETGKIIRTVGTHMDITELRQAEKTIRESEHKYRSIFENIQVVYLELDIDGSIQEVSPYVEKLFGYQREELIHHNWAVFWPEPTLQDNFNQELIKKERIEDLEVTFRDKIGNNVIGYLSASVETDHDNSPVKFICSFLDITKRKQSEIALKESEIRYKNLCDNMKSGVVIYRAVNEGEDFEIMDFNKGAETIENVSKVKLIGQLITEVFPGVKDFGLFEVLQRVYRTGASENHPVSYYKDDHTEGWRENYIYKLPSGEIVAIYEDQSKRKEAELALKRAHEELEQKIEQRTRELKESNRQLGQEIRMRRETEHELLFAKHLAEAANKAKSDFLANISHELRNPMHHILSYSKYGIEKFETVSPEKHLHYFNQIRKSADRLMYLLNDLLDLSKMEAGRMDYKFIITDIYKLVQDITTEFKTQLMEKQITLIVDKAIVNTHIECDMLRIGQVIRNLISNSIKYSSENSRISIDFDTQDQEAGSGKKELFQVSVADQGVGIPSEELDFVFDKFTQSSKTKTGAGGTGLGLAICREIIHVHKGSIWAENNEDGGSVFRFVIPYRHT